MTKQKLDTFEFIGKLTRMKERTYIEIPKQYLDGLKELHLENKHLKIRIEDALSS